MSNCEIWLQRIRINSKVGNWICFWSAKNCVRLIWNWRRIKYTVTDIFYFVTSLNGCVPTKLVSYSESMTSKPLCIESFNCYSWTVGCNSRCHRVRILILSFTPYVTSIYSRWTADRLVWCLSIQIVYTVTNKRLSKIHCWSNVVHIWLYSWTDATVVCVVARIFEINCK